VGVVICSHVPFCAPALNAVAREHVRHVSDHSKSAGGLHGPASRGARPLLAVIDKELAGVHARVDNPGSAARMPAHTSTAVGTPSSLQLSSA
jgi:hypothetical protein